MGFQQPIALRGKEYFKWDLMQFGIRAHDETFVCAQFRNAAEEQFSESARIIISSGTGTDCAGQRFDGLTDGCSTSQPVNSRDGAGRDNGKRIWLRQHELQKQFVSAQYLLELP